MDTLKKSKPPLKLVSARLTFKARAADQAEELYQLVDKNREHLRPWMPWEKTTQTTADTKKFIQMMIEGWNEFSEFDYSMYDNNTNRLIGSFGFHTINWDKHSCHLGYWIDKSHEGKGYISEAIKLFEGIAKNLGFHKMIITCDAGNTRSAETALKNGFKKEAHFVDESFRNGKFRDQLLFAKFTTPKKIWQPPIIETERLILRPLQESDAPAILQYCNNKNVTQYTSWSPHKNLNDSLELVRHAHRNYEKKMPEPYGITLKNEDTVIGTAGYLIVSEKNKTIELAYALSEKHWGQGYIEEVNRALIKSAFTDHDINRIQARCDERNTQSIRVLEKLGFKLEGTLRQAFLSENRFWDLNLYALLKDKWKQK